MHVIRACSLSVWTQVVSMLVLQSDNKVHKNNTLDHAWLSYFQDFPITMITIPYDTTWASSKKQEIHFSLMHDWVMFLGTFTFSCRNIFLFCTFYCMVMLTRLVQNNINILKTLIEEWLSDGYPGHHKQGPSQFNNTGSRMSIYVPECLQNNHILLIGTCSYHIFKVRLR